MNNGKGRSVFVSFRENGTITLYCHIPYEPPPDYIHHIGYTGRSLSKPTT